MSIVGIDQSFTSTALWIAHDDGTYDKVVIKSDKTQDVFDRAQFIASTVVHHVKKYKVEEIRIEGLAFGSTGSSTRDLAGLQMLIVCELRHEGYDPKIIPPNTLKKASTQDGRASKEKMHDSLPQPIKDALASTKKAHGLYDLVDAYWLAQY